MENTLLFWRTFSRFSFITLSILLFFSSAQAQKYFELKDGRHDMSLLSNDVGQTNSGVRIEDAFNNAADRSLWQFVHVEDQYYHILDKSGTFGIYVNGSRAFNKPWQNSDEFLWELVDVDGTGELFFIKSKLNDRYLTPGFTYDANVYVQDSANNDVKNDLDVQFFRLIDKGGIGENPKDSQGNEIFPQMAFSTTTANGTILNMYIKTRSICGDRPGFEVYENGQQPPTDGQAFMNGFDESEYSLFEGRKDLRINVYARSKNNIRLDHPDNEISMSNPFETWESEIDADTLILELKQGNNTWRWYRGTYKFNLDYGTPTMFISSFLQERNNNGQGVNNVFIQAPFAVSGITKSEVPVLGYSTQPQIPYLILHDPPGDGSSSEFQDTKTTCRKFEDSYEKDSKLKTYAKVKIGVAGSAGFIVTTDFEFSVTFSAGLTGGDLMIEKNTEETCVTVNNGFATSDLPGAEEGEDVFIGYGQDLNYGVYDIVDFIEDSCKINIKSELTFSERNPGEYRKFIYTKSGILADIAYLQTVVADSNNLDDRTVNNAFNQIKVWEQVLEMNDENIAMATDNIGDVSFNAGTTSTWSETVKVVDTRSIETKHFIEGTAGLESVMEVGGSGVTTGFEYTMKKTYGQTANLSEEQAKLIKYTLKDNDQGDVFNVDIFRDPMFGTPLFRTVGGTKSSCPYEGGYARDQPRLTYEFATSDSMVVSGVPKGQDAVFNVMICNDSNEDRDYKLKLDDRSNATLNAIVIAAGTEINNNPDGRTFPDIKSGECFDLEVIVRQTNQNRLNYPRLELILSPECDDEKSIESNLFLSAYFSTGTKVNEISVVSSLALYPNPTYGEMNIDFTLDETETVAFEVYDLNGRLMKAMSPTTFAAGDHRQNIDLFGLNPGVYHLSIRTAKAVVSRRVVIQQ